MFSTLAEFRQRVAAFDEQKIKRWLWRYCRFQLLAVYEDLKQTVYTELMAANFEQVSKIRDLDKFIYGVCRNVGVDWLREIKKRARLDDTVKQLPEPSPQRTPENTVIEKDQRLSIERAIDQLPKRQREIYVLHHIDGCDIESIAQITGCRVSTIKRTIYNAMTNLRKILSREESARAARSKE